MKCVWLRAVVWSMLFVCFAGVPALGQDAADSGLTAEQGLAVEANELRATIEEHWSDLTALEEQLVDSSGTDTLALRERGRSLLIEFHGDLALFSTNIVGREEVGLDATADRERVTELMQNSVTFLQDAAERFLEQGEELRLQLDTASAGDVPGIEEEIEYADEWYGNTLGFLLNQTVTMEEFGIDAKKQRSFLSEHFASRAELVAGRVMLAREEVERVARLAAVDPTNTEIASELDLAEGDLTTLVDQLQETSRLMEEIGMDSSDYEQLIFEVTGEITTDLLNKDVLGGLAKSWARAAGEWVRQHGPGAVFKVILFFGILFAFRILSKLARKVVLRAMKASPLDVSLLLERTALSLTGTVVMLFGLLVALSQVGVEVAPLLAGLGVAGFIIGFALQDTLGNFASGVMILLYRPYDVGDLVEAAGVNGKVKDMSLVSTTILTLDNQTLIIPNSKIWGDVIKNVTAQTHRRIDMVFGIGYADDIPKAEKVLREILDAHDGVLDDPEPTVKLHNLGDSSVDFVVRPWVDTDDYWDVYWDVTREVKMRFDAEEISIPFPQRDVHVFQDGGDDEN